MSRYPIFCIMAAVVVSSLCLAVWGGRDTQHEMPGTPVESAAPGLSAADDSNARDSVRVVSDAEFGAGFSTSLVPIFSSWSFNRAVEFTGLRSFLIRTAEDHPGDVLERYVWPYSTSYNIQGLGSRGSQHLYLSGENRAGQIVIEEWEIASRSGGKSSRRLSGAPVQPIGVPTSFMHSEVFVVGGTLGNVEARRLAPLINKDQVVVTSEFPFVRLLEADPEGRFLIVLGGDKSVYQIDLLSPNRGVITEILDPVVAWPLADQDWFENCWVSRVQHSQFGRLWILGEVVQADSLDQAQPATHVVMIDAGNDGVFEQTLVLGDGDAVTLGYMDRGQYVDTFDGVFN